MQRIFLLTLLLTTLHTELNTKVSECSAYTQITAPLIQASQALDEYTATCPHGADQANLIQYLNYYRSWYQAVTPAPRALVESLSPAAVIFIDQLRAIAEQFITTPEQRPGASKLSAAGNCFYQKIILLTKSQLLGIANTICIPTLDTISY